MGIPLRATLAAALASFAAFAGEPAAPLFATPFSIVGTGGENERRHSEPVELAPGATYFFSFSARRPNGGSGTVVSGPDCANVDWRIDDATSAVRRFVFRTPSGAARRRRFHLGGWRMTGEVAFEDAALRPVIAEWAESDGMALGHGESIQGNRYSFTTALESDARNDARPLLGHTAEFNTDRWVLFDGLGATYRHAIAGRRLLDGRVTVHCVFSASGCAEVQASTDGASWVAVGAVSNTGSASFAVPDGLFPAEELSIRLLGGRKASIQIGSYAFSGGIDGEPVSAVGSTRYLDAETGEELADVRIPPHHYYEEGYGDWLAATNGVVYWSAPSDRKVPPARRPPKAGGKAGLSLQVAANESEAVQLVISPKGSLEGVQVSLLGDLADGMRRLPASAVDIRRVGYVRVDRPTDKTGVCDWWPDPLLPQEGAGGAVPAGGSQPFRIRVRPPKGTQKGTYCGTVVVSSSAGVCEIPLKVEVFGFALPDTMTCETAFGFSPWTVFNYHAAKTEEDRRTLYGKYLRLLADNHISPYDPAQLDRWRVEWKGLGPDPATAEPVFDWTAWDAALEKAFAEYHFNTFRIALDGFGYGSGFDKVEVREPPSFLGHSATNAVYDALMARYLGAVEAHLREKGWIGKAYAYWFDEPVPRDYPFIMAGCKTMERHSPSIRRMLTEQPEAELLGGPNLWCPLTFSLHSKGEAACRAAGDQFWWYICCDPKAPYATEFIDHPGIEPRVWLWQTWREKVRGILVWETCYWTNKGAYPASPQNPYEDTMSWANSTVGFGNGDGRFIYPPPAAADGKAENTVLDDPVPSLRLEMLCDGIEDYEYFAMLERLLGTASPEAGKRFGALLDVPPEVTSGLTKFSRDSHAILAHRLAIARAIEELGKATETARLLPGEYREGGTGAARPLPAAWGVHFRKDETWKWKFAWLHVTAEAEGTLSVSVNRPFEPIGPEKADVAQPPAFAPKTFPVKEGANWVKVPISCLREMRFEVSCDAPASCDAMLFAKDETFDAATLSAEAVAAIPRRAPRTEFADGLFERNPLMPLRDYAAAVARRAGVKTSEPQPTADANGAALYRGKPYFPMMMYHATCNKDEHILAGVPLNVFGDRTPREPSPYPRLLMDTGLFSRDWSYDEYFAVALGQAKGVEANRTAILYLADEPDGAYDAIGLRRLHELAKAAMPGVPTCYCFCTFAAVDSDKSRTCDFPCVDHYPIGSRFPWMSVQAIGWMVD